MVVLLHLFNNFVFYAHNAQVELHKTYFALLYIILDDISGRGENILVQNFPEVLKVMFMAWWPGRSPYHGVNSNWYSGLWHIISMFFHILDLTVMWMQQSCICILVVLHEMAFCVKLLFFMGFYCFLCLISFIKIKSLWPQIWTKSLFLPEVSSNWKKKKKTTTTTTTTKQKKNNNNNKTKKTTTTTKQKKKNNNNKTKKQKTLNFA